MRFLRSVENLPDMLQETYDLVAQVPRGRVTTYGEVARALGDVVASRYVGLAMSMNDDIVRVPCRRVVQSDGLVGGYTGGGPRKKIRLLREEGIGIVGEKIVDLEKVLFKDFVSNYPLRDLRRRQRRLKRQLSVERLGRRMDRIAGIDVAYEGDHAFAAMVVFDLESGKETERIVIEGEASFPYVPTYLAFREIPVVAPLMRFVDNRTVIMYDGNGILHPEGFGIASQVGVVFDVPTIGVAKKLLCGSLATRGPGLSRQVRLGGKIVGHALPGVRGGKPVYVSAGHRLSSKDALMISARFRVHRVPEPTRRAHIVAEAARHGKNNK